MQTLPIAKFSMQAPLKLMGEVTTAGGRVLCVTAMGRDLDEASDIAYQGTEGISWSGAKYRRDIGWRARTR